ncbi:MAG: hypothetical protein LBP73_05275 [Clostridiales Family XIII bacterium]|nr:hypothetical protein [Clostridiales Family XIII bacterium]
MNDVKLRVIRGGLHPAAHRADRRFSSAFATDTRLMGVFVLYIHWTSAEAEFDADLHQFFYIDAEKFGIEAYRSVEGNNADLLYDVEQTMIGGLGGSKADISESEAVFIVKKYAGMAKVGGAGLPAGKEEFTFILERSDTLTRPKEDSLFNKLCVPLESNEHTINCFLMRYFAGDAEAVRRLAAKPVPMGAAPAGRGETLCKNAIEPYSNPSGTSYLCESLTEKNNRYRLVLSEICVSAKRVSSFRIRSCFFVSASEAAMLLSRPEYITVYDVMIEIGDIRRLIARLYPNAMQKNRGSGCLYLQFKNNNEHLKESVYRMNDDIRGIFFVSDHGQFIVAAYSLPVISRIEKELRLTVRAGLRLHAKYEFKESVFYEFMQSDFLDFSDFVDYLNEFEPGE